MTKEDSLARYRRGREAWNGWASDLLERDHSEADALADFRECVFDQPADFKGFVFPGQVLFTGATLKHGASFREAVFESEVSFETATLGGDASFVKATFKHDTSFEGAIFRGGANCAFATFKGMAILMDVKFDKPAAFTNATFERSVTFNRTNIRETVRISQAFA